MMKGVVALFLLACGSDSDGGDDPNAASFALGTLCDSSRPQDCASKKCVDVVGGKASNGGTSTDFDTEGNKGFICTKSCAGDGDCAGISFAGNNKYQTQSEAWTCKGGVCSVVLTPPPSSSSNSCNGCGGAFCSGKCIGCPQC